MRAWSVVSVFDGMACGALALQAAGIEIESYDAFEYDVESASPSKGRPYGYAALTSQHNFPFITHHGDVFEADFTKFEGVDLVCGGSPCTYWSIAQKNNRETEASGLGWELFQQYVRAIKEAKPKFFIYENNKSMSKAIRQSIDEAFGFEAVLINSALVSAQNRQRLYWVGRRNEDGTYSKVNVEQPEDRGIVLRDILESGVVDREKSYPLLVSHQGNARDYFKKQHAQIVCEPINTTDDGDKARTLMAGYYKYGTATLITNEGFKGGTTAVAEGVNVTDGEKSHTLKAQYYKNGIANFITNGGFGATAVAEPIRIGDIGSNSQAHRVYSCDGKSVTLSANGGGQGGKTGLYATPMRVPEATKQGYVDIAPGDCVDLSFPSSKTRRGRSMKEKSNCLMANSSELYQYCGTIDKPIYEVKDGFITIKDKKYPIKLKDGYYIIRKLTVRECMRLQTVPEWYEFPVSNSQAYKMLGNGWTVEVIAHLINSCLSDKGDAQPKLEQMKFF